MQGNLLSVPTDCPQRDGRLRWTTDGIIPFVVTDVLKHQPGKDFPGPDATAVWSDAGVWGAVDDRPDVR